MVVVIAVGTFEVNVFSYQGSISSSYQTAQSAQIMLKTMLVELREMSPGANGSYSLIKAATSSVSFFSDPDGDGITEQMTYSLVGTTLYKAIINPTGSSPSYVYNPANQSTTTLVTNVRNASSTPLFQYFDTNYNGTSSPLTIPVTTTAVRLIKVSLTLDIDPKRSPLPVTYTIQASLRNLKSNL